MMSRNDKLLVLLWLPIDYFKAIKNHKKVKGKLKPKYSRSYTLYFFSVVRDLLVNGRVNVSKYAKVGEKIDLTKSKTGWVDV